MKKIIISLLLFAAGVMNTTAQACPFIRLWRSRQNTATCAAYVVKNDGPKWEENCKRQREYLPAPPPVDVPPLLAIENNAETMSKDVIGYVNELNALRRRYGLRPVQLDIALVEASQSHSQHQAARGQIFHAQGCGAEVVAQNWGSGISQALRQWLESPPHRALILSANFTRVGVGVCKTEIGANYCTIRLR